MEETVKKQKRYWTPQQKFEILKDIEKHRTITEGLERYQLVYSVYRKWKRQLEVGVNTSLRNGKALKPAEVKSLQAENKKRCHYR